MYWIDTSVFIEAAHGPYRPDRFPRVWAFLSEQLAQGNVGSPKIVFEELTAGRDWLADWSRHRKQWLSLRCPRPVQRNVASILDSLYANKKYKQAQVLEFSQGADSWVIGSAMVKGETVVSFETVRSRSKIKIPEVCRLNDIEHIDLFELLTRLDFTS